MEKYNKPKIIYIAGYGRSGSTILDILLGNHPNVRSAGELVYLFDKKNHHQYECSCRKMVEDCEFWKPAIDEINLPDKNLVIDIDNLLTFPKILLFKTFASKYQQYSLINNSLFKIISEKTGTDYIVDSSKSSYPIASRFLALKKIAGLDTYVIHLVRNGLQNYNSILKGSNRELEGRNPKDFGAAIKGPILWSLTNLWTLFLGKLMGKNKYIRVKYEDLINHPENTLGIIGNFLNLDMSELEERVSSKSKLSIGHVIAGNRVRLNDSLVLFDTVPKDNKFLSIYHKIYFYAVAGLTNILLGY